MKTEKIIDNLLNNKYFISKSLEFQIKEILDIDISNEEKNIILINILDDKIGLHGNGWLDEDIFLITPLLDILNSNEKNKLKKIINFLDDKSLLL